MAAPDIPMFARRLTVIVYFAVVLIPVLLTDFKLATIALYACAYLMAALIVAVSPFLATTGRSLEAISGGHDRAPAEAMGGPGG